MLENVNIYKQCSRLNSKIIMGIYNRLHLIDHSLYMHNFKTKLSPQVSLGLVVLLLTSIFKHSLQTEPISGDRIAKPGDFPYQAFVKWDTKFKCGAVLVKVDEYIVALTVSYCAAYWAQEHSSSTIVHVIAGKTNVKRTALELTEQEKYVVCHIHNKLEPQHMNNNLAILILNSQIDYTTSVDIIEMSQVKLQSEEDLEVIGWQKEAGRNTNVNSELQVSEVRAINFTDCEYIFEKECEKKIQESIFCTKSPPKWTNYRAGLAVGSAVVSKRTGLLNGLLTYSVGMSCIEHQEVPHLVMYIDIVDYVPWIRSRVRSYFHGNHSICAVVPDRSSRHLKPELEKFEVDKK